MAIQGLLFKPGGMLKGTFDYSHEETQAEAEQLREDVGLPTEPLHPKQNPIPLRKKNGELKTTVSDGKRRKKRKTATGRTNYQDGEKP